MRSKKRQRLCNNRGITLVEILISTFLIIVGICGSLLCFTSAMASTQMAKDMTIASTHGEYVLEEMRAMATLAEITSADWDAFVTNAGLDTLDNESILVTFADAGADPLNITVDVAWKTRNRQHAISLVTELTK